MAKPEEKDHHPQHDYDRGGQRRRQSGGPGQEGCAGGSRRVGEPDRGRNGGAPSPTVAARLADLMLRTARRLRRAEAKELAALGLTHGQARALRVLHRHGSPMRISELAERLEIVPRSATTVVDMLEQAGLVERRKDPEDRRAVLAALTVAGSELLRRMREERRAAAEALFGRLPETQQHELLEVLEALQGDEAAGDSRLAAGGAATAGGGALADGASPTGRGSAGPAGATGPTGSAANNVGGA